MKLISSLSIRCFISAVFAIQACLHVQADPSPIQGNQVIEPSSDDNRSPVPHCVHGVMTMSYVWNSDQ